MNARVQSASIIAAVVVLDRITKWYIRTSFTPWDMVTVIPRFFNIIHAENPGAAFGVLADSGGEWGRLLLVAVSLAVMGIIGAILWRGAGGALMRTGFSLVFGGALGNLIDRAFRGTVTDFLQFFFGNYEFPSFNVADSAITIGAALLLIDLWRSKESRAQKTA